MEFLVVFCTFPDAETAKRIAREVIEARLAACANVTAPVTSIYRWEGNVEEAAETLVIFKTMRARFEDLQAKLLSLHPYDLPEIIALPLAEGSPKYLQWLGEGCS